MIERYLLATSLLLSGLSPSAAAQSSWKTTISDRKTAPDGVTKGWLIEIPWPDQDDKSQAWRKLAVTLVISRNGKVIRRIETAQTFWSWSFWNGGKEVAVQVGPPHGRSGFGRIDIRTGKWLEEWDGDGDDMKAPAWVKAAYDDGGG